MSQISTSNKWRKSLIKLGDDNYIMNNRLENIFKKANMEVEKSGISDPELKKIAFSKAVDFYLNQENNLTQNQRKSENSNESRANNFWICLSTSTGIQEQTLKDVYAQKDEQILLVISLVPGDSKTDRQRNLAALILLAYHEGLNMEWIPAKHLAEAAGHSKLYDTSNFARNLRGYDWFRSEGVKKGVKYRLSGPGINRAKEILRTISQ